MRKARAGGWGGEGGCECASASACVVYTRYVGACVVGGVVHVVVHVCIYVKF